MLFNSNYEINDKEELQFAVNYFMNYVENHGGHLSDRFINELNIKLVNQMNGGSLGVANVEKNLVTLKKPASVVTLFHELRHISDAWQDENGDWHYAWDGNTRGSFELINPNTKEVKLLNGQTGRFMGEAVAEYYASKVFWSLFDDNPTMQKRAIEYTKNNRTFYDFEVETFIKICNKLGLDTDFVLNLDSENEYNRKIIRERCYEISGDPSLWDKIECTLDFYEEAKCLKLNGYNLTNNNDINKALKVANSYIDKYLTFKSRQMN